MTAGESHDIKHSGANKTVIPTTTFKAHLIYCNTSTDHRKNAGKLTEQYFYHKQLKEALRNKLIS